VRLSAYAWVVLGGMGLKLAVRRKKRAGEAGGVGKRSGGRLTQRANRGLARACALAFVAHVGHDLREYNLHVYERWVGHVAFAADQMVLGVKVRIVVAKVMMAGETSKGRVQGRHA